MGEYIKAYPYDYDYDFILGELVVVCRTKPCKLWIPCFFVAMLAFCGPCNVLADSGGESSAVILHVADVV